MEGMEGNGEEITGKCSYFRFWGPYRCFRLSVAVAELSLLANTIFHLEIVLYPRFFVRILVVPFIVAEI